MSYVKSIRFKLMLLVAVPLAVLAVAYIIIAMVSSNIQIDRNSAASAVASEHTILETISSWSETNLNYAQIIADQPSPDFIDALKQKNRNKIIELTKDVFEHSGNDAMTFADMNGDAIVRLQDPEKYGDNITASIAAADALKGKSVNYIYSTMNNGFSIAAGVPIVDESGTQVAIMVFIKRLDTETNIQSLKRFTGSDVVVYKEDTAVISSFENDSFSAPLDQATWETLQQGDSVDEVMNLNGEKKFVRYIPLNSGNGEVVGAIKTILTHEDRGWITFLWIIVFFISALSFFPLISRNIVKIVMPIRELSKQAQTLATGDVSTDIKITRTDELGILQTSMQNLTVSLRNTSLLMEEIAEGDFSGKHTPLSDKDLLGQSIVKVLDKNNIMLREIQEAARQVASDSASIAGGAQMLAAGSTEQAATIEELSAAIAQVQDQTNHGAKISEETNTDVKQVGALMQETNASMTMLKDAMYQVNSASTEIAKVIKVIDDIAFRTNILALNAAVEAARAGVQGKGFAVVADEVRNLAAKSAEAARETATLIEDAIVAFQKGVPVSEQVSESMDQTSIIAASSAKSMEAVTNVCMQSNVAVTQISEGINQISRVVQANTATADQSALSSEQLSNQSSMLMGIVEQYKLRDTE